jgi:DNA-directed RNA polymerase specialized sigma24 family protein
VVNLSGQKLGKEIIEACRAGDRDAFRALYDLYKDRVYSVSFHFLNGDAAAASDATQQVFLKLITAMTSVDLGFELRPAFVELIYRFLRCLHLAVGLL